ncbi:MAG: hypothetical protein N2D54_06315 [Chloroflexota bacterium]
MKAPQEDATAPEYVCRNNALIMGFLFYAAPQNNAWFTAHPSLEHHPERMNNRVYYEFCLLKIPI